MSSEKKQFTIKPFGRNAILIEWPKLINRKTLHEINHMDRWIQEQFKNESIETTTGYNSLVIFYAPMKFTFTNMVEIINGVPGLSAKLIDHGKLWEIPVCYEEEYALDMDLVSQYSNLTFVEIVHLHSRVIYDVYFLGFLPGFVYLAQVDQAIRIPRKETPRLKVPAGSVGIANEQTGIYPFASPGGWQIIGRSPHIFFNEKNDPPCDLAAGDQVRFLPIDQHKFQIYKQLPS